MVATAPNEGPPKKPMPTWILALVVLGGLALLLVPVMGALAAYGVRKYLANAKMAEATSTLGQIAKDAAIAHGEQALLGKHHGRGASGHPLRRSASAPIPASMESVRGVTYPSTAAEWEADRGTNARFFCLKFSMSRPQYDQYAYTSRGTGASGDGFTAYARGDRNGNGRASEFSLGGTVDASGRLNVAPTTQETNPEE